MGLANCATGKTRGDREECAGGHHTCFLDHLVGDLLEMHRHVDAQRRGGLNIDNLLHRQVGGVRALENAIEVPRRQTVN